MSTSRPVGLRFTQFYVVVLVAMGLLGLLAQSSTQYATVSLLSDAHAVNIAGRQRMLSQRVSKGALELAAATERGDGAAANAARAEIGRAVELFESSHAELVTGAKDDAIRARFVALRPAFDAVRSAAREVADASNDAERRDATRRLLAREGAFLEGMDALVFALEDAANTRVEELQGRQATFFIVQLLALVAAGLFIFRPAVAQLVRALDALEEERRRRVAELEEVRLAEQARVGRDLHDGLCQELAGIAMLLGTFDRRVQAGEVDGAQLAPIRSLVADAPAHAGRLRWLIRRLGPSPPFPARRLSRGLYPAVLEREGLGPALEQLVEDAVVRHPEPEVLLTVDVQAGLPGTVENTLYRVAQEALSNALRHAEATRVDVSLTVTEGAAERRVDDDGVGFSRSAVELGMGLDSMRKRADLLGAQHEVSGGPGEGTRVRFRVEDPQR
mgnify:CR=1 FL=1